MHYATEKSVFFLNYWETKKLCRRNA